MLLPSFIMSFSKVTWLSTNLSHVCQSPLLYRTNKWELSVSSRNSRKASIKSDSETEEPVAMFGCPCESNVHRIRSLTTPLGKKVSWKKNHRIEIIILPFNWQTEGVTGLEELAFLRDLAELNNGTSYQESPRLNLPPKQVLLNVILEIHQGRNMLMMFWL